MDDALYRFTYLLTYLLTIITQCELSAVELSSSWFGIVIRRVGDTVMTSSGRRDRLSVVVVCCLFIIAVQFSNVVGFYLQGSRTSYARLPRWHSCSNSSLTLGFWTSLSDALLVYADDGGVSSFLVLSVDNGSVVARISVAVDDQAARLDHDVTTLRAVSRPVNDRHWHTVRLIGVHCNYREIGLPAAGIEFVWRIRGCTLIRQYMCT